MGRKRSQALVDNIAADIIKRKKLRFELDGIEKERHFFINDEDVSRGMAWVYAKDLAETEEVAAAVSAKIRRLHPAVLGKVLAAGPAIPDVKKCGTAVRRKLAAHTLTERIYDLLERDEQPLIRETLSED